MQPRQNNARPKKEHTDLKKPGLATRNLGMIAQRCIFWHRFLPTSVRNYYDVEDMISEVAIHVIRRSHHYNKKRGRESTLVHSIADNKCRTILAHYKTLKISACDTVALTPLVAYKLGSGEYEKYRRSLDAVERVIEYASDAVLDLIEKIISQKLCNGNRPVFIGREKGEDVPVICINRTSVSVSLAEEFRKLADRHHANLEDWLRVLHYASD